jgi:hypothetical protein
MFSVLCSLPFRINFSEPGILKLTETRFAPLFSRIFAKPKSTYSSLHTAAKRIVRPHSMSNSRKSYR